MRILPSDLGKYLLHFSVGIRFVIGELEKRKGHFEAGEQSFSFAHAPGKEDKEVILVQSWRFEGPFTMNVKRHVCDIASDIPFINCSD